MRVLTKAALVGAALLAFATTSASAAIVCSRDVCWHTHEAYDSPPDARVTLACGPARKIHLPRT